MSLGRCVSGVFEGPGRIDQETRDGAEFRAGEFQQYQEHDEGAAPVLGTGGSGIQGSMQQQYCDVCREIRAQQTLASRDAVQSARRGKYLITEIAKAILGATIEIETSACTSGWQLRARRRGGVHDTIDLGDAVSTRLRRERIVASVGEGHVR